MPTKTPPPPPVELDELLAAEFEYIAQTATQANEDRARVSSFYLIAVGSLVAALFSTQLFDTDKFTETVKLMFSGLFILLTLLGISTIMQLARLRTAWYESMLALNQIKEFAMKQNPELTSAFRWTSKTLPPKHKKNSVSYYQALEVALIGGLMFGASIFFFQQAFFAVSLLTWLICAILGFVFVYIQMSIYGKLTK
jgi:predicted lipid-binding transport protein (Tim44 family)